MVRGSFKTFLNMIFSELWIIRRIVYVSMILMADIIFNYGITLSAGYHLQLNSMYNSTTESPDFANKVLNTYFNSVINKSRALEEIIYSDIINNIKSLMKSEHPPEAQATKDFKVNINGEPKRNNTNLFNSVNYLTSYKTNVFLSNDNHIVKAEGSEYVSANFTPLDFPSFDQDEYLLGYSGNPFGTRKSMAGVVPLDVTMPEPQNESRGEAVTDPRKKRSVLHLYNMVLCATGCNPFSYKGYGCYCGFLGSGYVVDGIDSCCKMHDWCYNTAGCPMFFEYFIPYLWKCYHRQPLCAIDHGYYGGPSSCAQRLCECDRQLALCLRRYPCPSTKALCTSSPWRLLQNIIML